MVHARNLAAMGAQRNLDAKTTSLPTHYLRCICLPGIYLLIQLQSPRQLAQLVSRDDLLGFTVAEWFPCATDVPNSVLQGQRRISELPISILKNMAKRYLSNPLETAGVLDLQLPIIPTGRKSLSKSFKRRTRGFLWWYCAPNFRHIPGKGSTIFDSSKRKLCFCSDW